MSTAGIVLLQPGPKHLLLVPTCRMKPRIGVATGVFVRAVLSKRRPCHFDRMGLPADKVLRELIFVPRSFPAPPQLK